MPTVAGRRGSSLALRVEQPLGFELGLEPGIGLVQRTETGPPHQLDVELKLAPRLVQRRTRAHFDLRPIGRHPVEVLRLVAEHHAVDLRPRVLEGEVPMPRVVALEVRDLAGDPGQRELAFDHFAGTAVEFGDGEDTRCGHRRIEADHARDSSRHVTPGRRHEM